MSCKARQASPACFWSASGCSRRFSPSAIELFDPLGQIAELQHAPPGAIEPHSGLPYLFGGDKLARDVFGRVIAGARIVLIIAPLATLLALSLGIALGLPAGYFGRRVDAVLSFLANLVLAFPIILLFYLLVSPGILETPIPYTLAASSSPFRSSSSASSSSPATAPSRCSSRSGWR